MNVEVPYGQENGPFLVQTQIGNWFFFHHQDISLFFLPKLLQQKIN